MMTRILTILFALFSSCGAFLIQANGNAPIIKNLALDMHKPKFHEVATSVATSVAITFYASPLAALAEEADNYEYGAVDAPIGLAWGAGILAILTAGVPVLLQGGEKALEQQRLDEASRGATFGKGGNDVLGKRR
eukprot:CAMPEP_0178913060 /NCGR_PEP_ID=MMETSP0786-20121207/10624_1 /TAXON_ID=186022 /ORGANISM="Thalassionema frauenfeldii, Strain CCMP 1798" /LENGTH=134 /DNA_ID=CAMNT_0020585743 /DNA_START=79 /DNA_END=483 /DNA_ORIENTATION=+